MLPAQAGIPIGPHAVRRQIFVPESGRRKPCVRGLFAARFKSLPDRSGAIMAGLVKSAAMEIRQDDPTAPHVADLLAHHLRELREVMAEHAFALDASGLSAPSVTFWTAWDGETLMGFGALKQLGPSHGEVKSMRASPIARGKGVGRAILAHIVTEARKRGYDRLSLETGTAALHVPAISLYRSAGFVSCGAFGDYQPSAHNQFFRLDLAV